MNRIKIFLILSFLFTYSQAFSQISTNFQVFLDALAKVESGGNIRAYNKNENAIGIYQIRKLYFIDAQSVNNNLNKYAHTSCYDPNIAREVVIAYFKKYEPHALRVGDWETLARLHNSGPQWRKKKSLTDGYWRKIRVALGK